MNKILIGGIIVIVIAGAFLFSRLPSSEKGDVLANNSTSEFKKDLDSGVAIYDVRTPEEFSVGFIKGSANLPLAEIESGSVPTESKDEKIYLYCRSGNRSAQAKRLLEKAGFTNIIDLGSIEDVVKNGGEKVT